MRKINKQKKCTPKGMNIKTFHSYQMVRNSAALANSFKDCSYQIG